MSEEFTPVTNTQKLDDDRLAIKLMQMINLANECVQEMNRRDYYVLQFRIDDETKEIKFAKLRLEKDYLGAQHMDLEGAVFE